MLSALQHVSDIPEDEIVATIYDLLIPLHASPSNPLTNPPTLQNGLAHLLAYPTSPTPLRLALRAHLRDAEDVVHVLKVLDAWLKRGIQFDVWELDGLQSASKKGKSVGVSASTGRKKVKGAGMIPALEHVRGLFLKTLQMLTFPWVLDHNVHSSYPRYTPPNTPATPPRARATSVYISESIASARA
jgi:hypothetical protein